MAGLYEIPQLPSRDESRDRVDRGDPFREVQLLFRLLGTARDMPGVGSQAAGAISTAKRDRMSVPRRDQRGVCYHPSSETSSDRSMDRGRI